MHYDRNRVTIDNEKARSANEKRFTYDDNLKRQRILKRNVKPLPQSKSVIQLKKPEKPINYLHQMRAIRELSQLSKEVDLAVAENQMYFPDEETINMTTAQR